MPREEVLSNVKPLNKSQWAGYPETKKQLSESLIEKNNNNNKKRKSDRLYDLASGQGTAHER